MSQLWARLPRFARQQAGQPLPPVRVETAVCHSCPQIAQRHRSLRPERAPSCLGSIPALRSGCSSAATAGARTAKDRSGGTRLWVRAHRSSPQTGQPVPAAVRLATAALHSRPQVAHCHQTFRLERAATCSGSRPAFRVAWSSGTSSGWWAASDRSKPTVARVRARRLTPHIGQPCPEARFSMLVCHRWPQVAHRHHTLCLEPGVIRAGSSAPFPAYPFGDQVRVQSLKRLVGRHRPGALTAAALVVALRAAVPGAA